jgi:hypothetical protein
LLLGKRRVLSEKQVCAILADHGFALVRQQGSHAIMQKRIPGSTIRAGAQSPADRARHPFFDYSSVAVAAGRV